MTIILGINAYHADSSACIVKDGELIAAAEEERFNRIKHWAGFPCCAIQYCLDEAGIKLKDVNHVAINRKPSANLWKKISFVFANQPKPSAIFNRVKHAKKWTSIRKEFECISTGEQFSGDVHHVEHHLAHLASAFLVSPFDKAVVVSVDGFGDFASAEWGIGNSAEIKIAGRVCFPHSLGIFYEALTHYLGFPNYGDEYKVMGLAPYGRPCFIDEMRRIVLLKDDGTYRLNLKFFRHCKEGIAYEWKNCTPSTGQLFTPELEEMLGPPRCNGSELTQHYKDIACSVQAMYEEAFFHLLNSVHQRYKVDNIALGGGCAMNSVANGKVYKNTPFKKLYIQSAAGDAGGAIGGAFVVWHKLNKKGRRFLMDHAYWGPHFSSNYVEKILELKADDLVLQGCRVKQIRNENELYCQTAQSIADGCVVGWFQGRMEWGPRALGNRSIVCDPRRADIKDILNLKIKRRESFRPFAPSILRNVVAEWFETDDDVPFMMQAFQVRKDKRHLIPAVTHVDGSGRLQTVYRETNPRYYRLIEIFGELTSVPIVLNTSFNENEPVVCRPEEALDCFLRTKMDVLVLGDFFITRDERS
jgi:carbamoyltransferase